MLRIPVRELAGGALAAAAALSLGCGPDLPEGWEEAVRIDGLVQAECLGNPYEPFDERIELLAFPGAVHVDYREAHFRCEQPVEAFARRGAATLDILVQPENMSPGIVAGCDCLYDVSFTVGGLSAGEVAVTLYRRWDDLSSPNDPVLVGSATATVP